MILFASFLAVLVITYYAIDKPRQLLGNLTGKIHVRDLEKTVNTANRALSSSSSHISLLEQWMFHHTILYILVTVVHALEAITEL